MVVGSVLKYGGSVLKYGGSVLKYGGSVLKYVRVQYIRVPDLSQTKINMYHIHTCITYTLDCR